MRTDIERRISALEQKAGLGHEGIDVILRTFVSPGTDGPVRSEPRAIISLTDGWRVERAQGETAEEFVDRACRSAPRTPGRITRLREKMGSMS